MVGAVGDEEVIMAVVGAGAWKVSPTVGGVHLMREISPQTILNLSGSVINTT